MYGRNDIAAHQNATVAPGSNGENQIGLELATGGYRGKRMHENPRHCSLEGLTEISRSLQGVELSTLAPFDTIAVRTVNSDYRIFLLDPETGRALLEGGGQITEPMEVMVIGSSFGGSSLRTGWIGVGLGWRPVPMTSTCGRRQSNRSASSTKPLLNLHQVSLHARTALLKL